MPPKAKAKPKAKGGKFKKVEELAPTRIKNAKELRAEFAEVSRSPDGFDKDPSTLPKCVECSHCLWPVYPRECRVATRKTFERAGIFRDFDEKLKQKEAKKNAEADGDLDLGEDEEEEGANDDDDDSVGTVELLESKVNDLQAEVDTLTAETNVLQKENEELKGSIDDLEESLAAMEDKVEELEESERTWREKNSILRMENEDLRQYICRLGSRVGDLESDMVKKLLLITKLKEYIARFERRRALMMQGLEIKMFHLEGAGIVAGLFSIWMQDTAKEKRRREMQDMEARRRREVSDLNCQLGQERERVLSLNATVTKLRGSLKAAAQRMLMKVFSTTQKPWADGHALRTWCGAHATMKVENELIRTTQAIEELRVQFGAEQEKSQQLSGDLGDVMEELKKTTEERDDLASNIETLSGELGRLTGNMGKQASDIKKAAAEKARLAKEELERQLRAEAAKEIESLKADFKEERLTLEDEIETLKATIESVKRGVGGVGGGSKEDEQNRVVPKGQGVLCCGCLTQIVNRGMKQLPPVNANKAAQPSKDEKERRTFFQEELLGMPDPDDIFHTEFWKNRRDPMNGLRHIAGVSADALWPSSTRSASTGKLMPLSTKAMKTEKIFKPRAFR